MVFLDLIEETVMARVTLRDPAQVTESQRLLVLYILWTFNNKFPGQPVDKDRLRKAFAYAVSVVLLNDLNLELHLARETQSFPVLDGILSEAFDHHMIKDARRLEESFIFKSGASQSLMKLYPPDLPQDDLEILQEAARQVRCAYEKNVDLISYFHPNHRNNGTGIL